MDSQRKQDTGEKELLDIVIMTDQETHKSEIFVVDSEIKSFKETCIELRPELAEMKDMLLVGGGIQFYEPGGFATYCKLLTTEKGKGVSL